MIKPLVTRCVELDGTVPVARCTVCLMMMTHMGITHVSLPLGERFVYKVGMDLPVKCTVSLGMTRWRVILVIPRGKKFACGIGTVKTSVTFIVNRPTIRTLLTVVTRLVTKFVYNDGMVHFVIARPGTILPWVTSVILPPVKESVLMDGLVVTVMFIVYQGMIQQVIILATVVLELRNVCRTGLGETVPCTAGQGMIHWVDKSAQLTAADFVPVTGMVQVAACTVPPETTKAVSTLAI